MRRKVVQQGPATLMVSLPSKWVKKIGVKKGDEIDADTQGSKLIISTMSKSTEKKVSSIDLTGLDSSTITFTLRSLYISGADEIKIKFDEPDSPRYRLNKEEDILEIIHRFLAECIGYEIISEGKDFCNIKDLSTPNIEELEVLVRRVLLIIKDTISTLIQGLKKNDKQILKTVEKKHDTNTKFLLYCLRIINKFGIGKLNEKENIIFYTIKGLENIIDILRYQSFNGLKLKSKMNNQSILILKKIEKSYEYFYDFFYKFNMDNLTKLWELNYEINDSINKISKKISIDEYRILIESRMMIILFKDLMIARSGISH